MDSSRRRSQSSKGAPFEGLKSVRLESKQTFGYRVVGAGFGSQTFGLATRATGTAKKRLGVAKSIDSIGFPLFLMPEFRSDFSCFRSVCV